MKIGLMTWFRYNNYGTVLQAYSLQQILKKNKFNSILIDYYPRGTNKNVNELSYFFDLALSKINKTKYIVNKDMFEKFINNYLDTTDKCNNYYELKMLSEEFDAIICGSDQIWSPYNFDANYFLSFANKNKIMSYSPSFGMSAINDIYLEKRVSNLLNRFSIISVREKTGANLIKKISGKDAEVTLDPTLLLDKNGWNKILNKKLNNELKEKKYILCYFLGNSNKYYKNIIKCSQEYNLEIINIPAIGSQKLNKYSTIDNIGPSEFVTLIKNATLILTDSFHGTIFSINYNKDFFAYKRFKDSDKKSQNSRVIDILNKLNLNDRLIDAKSKINCKDINYNCVNNELKSIRNSSLNYLLIGLNKIIKNEKSNSSSITDICCGCGACKAICSKNSINISINSDGFYQYKKDENTCINCNLCKKVCPMNNISASKINYNNKCYYFKSNDKKVLKESSSGGAGFEIAKYYNSKGYYICGAVYNSKTRKVYHDIVQPFSLNDLKKFQGSKYLQSYTADALKKLLELPKDSKVVFFGTPCQVSAVDKLTKLKKIRDNYILVDLICHGVPSYNLWNKYLDEFKKNEEPINVKFRNKKFGWKNRKISLYNKGLNYNGSDNKDIFYKFFRNGYVDNFCCYECPFRDASSADLKIGDYWKPEYFKDKEGVSMIISITKIGKCIIEKLSDNNTVIEKSIDDFFKYQYVSNMNPNSCRDKLLDELKSDKKLKKIYSDNFKYEDIKNFLSKIYYYFRRINDEK